MEHTVDITYQMECQALLAARYATGKVRKTKYVDDPIVELTYMIKSRDPKPKGLDTGTLIHGRLERGLAMFTGTEG